VERRSATAERDGCSCVDDVNPNYAGAAAWAYESTFEPAVDDTPAGLGSWKLAGRPSRALRSRAEAKARRKRGGGEHVVAEERAQRSSGEVAIDVETKRGRHE
jgi:hypothetical protein